MSAEGKPTRAEYFALLRARGGLIGAEPRDRGAVVRLVGVRQREELEAWTRALGLEAIHDGAFDLRVFGFRRRRDGAPRSFNNRHED